MDLNSQPTPPRFRTAIYYGAWLAVLIIAAFAYWPGLRGPFLFDDFGTLADLGDLGGVRDWYTFKTYVFGGYTGPTGRPLALLSFLIDGNNWPTDAWPFKRTNLVIHLFNGVLLGVLTNQVLRLVDVERKTALKLALVSAAWWLLHPFLVSTTLYAVQRMAQLSTLFVFLGVIGYLYGRSFLSQKPTRAYVTMSLALGFGTLLAMISKENGILLPLQVLVLEFTIVASQGQRLPALNRYWASLFLAMPALVVVLYLGYDAVRSDFFEIRPPRDFSTYERLLTESRILFDYLRHWFVPELYTTGVFQDHILKSTGLFSPITTALSIALHLLIIGVCIARRRKWPILAFAVLFFYASHLLESTVIRLELYFEHRNYLAAAFLFLPLVVVLHEKASRKLFIAAAVSVLLVLGGITRYTATVWESYPTIVEASAEKAPTSARAQQQYSLLLFNAQRYDEALAVVDTAVQRIPGDEQLRLWRSTMRCQLGLLSGTEFEQMKQAVASRHYDPRAFDLYVAFIDSVLNDSCPSVSPIDLRSLFRDMLNVPLNADPLSPRYSQIRFFIGLVDIHLREPRRALDNFRESLQSRPGASKAMLMASLMASNGFYDEAMQLSDIALEELENADEGFLGSARVGEEDILEFRRNVREEVEAASGVPGEAPIADR